MSRSDIPMSTNACGSLKHSRRCYHWLFVWIVTTTLYLVDVILHGFNLHDFWIVPLSLLVFGYMFLIDMSDKVWWTEDQIWWRGMDFLSLIPMRHTVRIGQLNAVKSANHPANWIPARPFDRILFVSQADTITVSPSFHRREELEDLLRLIHAKHPEAVFEPQVIEFMEGGFSDWWRHR